METKICKDCKKTLNKDNFSKSTINGKQYCASYCKVCSKTRYKKWVCDNSKKRKELNKKWYINNREYAIEKTKEWTNENKERAKQNYNDWIIRNSEYKKQYDKVKRKQWAKDNGLQLKSTRIWNGTNTEYNLNDFLNNKGVVYFIGDTNGIYVKIGITSSIFSLSHRFRTIQGCNPMPLKLLGFIQDDNASKLERRLHEQFKQYSRIGEWFILAPEITRYIKENCMHIELANTMIGETYLSLPSILSDDLGY